VDVPPLSGTYFDRAALHRTDDEWLADAWQRSKVVVVSPKSLTPVDAASPSGHRALQLRTPGSIAADAPHRFLGIVGDDAYFTATVEPDDSGEWLTLREIGPHATELDGGLLATAIALEQWHQRHRFCPRDGSPTVESKGGWTRTCTVDGSEHFPRTDPAVIMLISDGGDRALLGRGPQWAPGRFSTLAGFVEPGESLEAAVAREVFEEVGVGIRDIRYVGSQPWPFPASLMLGFVARLDGDPSITLDPVEMAEAGWFTRDEVRRARDWTDEDVVAGDEGSRLRAIPPRFSISRYLIDRWLDGSV